MILKNKNHFFISFFRIGVICLLAVVLSIGIFVFYFGYEEVIRFIVKAFHIEDKLDQFKTSFLTRKRFLFLEFILVSLFFFLIYVFYKLERVCFWFLDVYHEIEKIISDIQRIIRDLSLFQKVVLASVFFFIIAYRIFYFYKFPLFIDEVSSYVYFVSPGFLISASYYSGPNNHVFYSELCALCDLFLNDPLLIMRLPSFIVSLALSFLLFLTIKKHYEFYTALLTLVLFSFSEHITFYSIQGRGYITFLFFTFVASVSLVKYLFQRKDVYLFLFIISSGLGFYTIPVFLYPFLSLVVFALFVITTNKWWGMIFQFFLIFSAVGLLVILLYLPVFLFNDFNVVVGNSWVAPIKNFNSELFPYLLKVNDYLWNWRNGSMISLVVTSGVLFVLFLNNKKEEAVFGLLFLFVPLMAISIQQVIPFERVWLYLFMPLSFGLSYLLVQLIFAIIKDQKIRKISIGTLVITMAAFLLISGGKEVSGKSFRYYNEMYSLTERIYKASPENILAEDYDCNTFIKFKYIMEDKVGHVRSLNSTSDKFDMIVTSKGLPPGIDSSRYAFAFGNSYVKAYALKK